MVDAQVRESDLNTPPKNLYSPKQNSEAILNIQLLTFRIIFSLPIHCNKNEHFVITLGNCAKHLKTHVTCQLYFIFLLRE